MKQLSPHVMKYIAKTYGRKMADGGKAEDTPEIAPDQATPPATVPAGYDSSPQANPNVAIDPNAVDAANLSNQDLNAPAASAAPYGGATGEWSVPSQPDQMAAAPINQPNASSISNAPPATPNQNMQALMTGQVPGIEQSLEESKAANTALANAKQGQGEGEVQALQNYQEAISKLPTANDIMGQFKAKDDALLSAYQNNKLDPNRYYNNQNTAQKITSGLALILSGIGSGLTHQPNLAAQMINDSINRDIDAQKNSQDQQLNLWKMNKEELGNELGADLATKNQLLTGVKSQLMQAASKAQGPISQAQAQGANALIDQEIAQNRFKMSLMQPTNDSIGLDPAKKVQFLVPPAQQSKVFDEIEAAQNATRSAPEILKAFDQAATEVRPTTAIANNQFPSATAIVPGLESANQKAMHTLLGPTFKDVEDTVRQAAMDNIFHNTTPQFGDSDSTIATKRASLESYLQSKSSAPNASGFGINLNQYPSTNVKGALPEKFDKVQQLKVQAFMKANPQVKDPQQAIQILKQNGRL